MLAHVPSFARIFRGSPDFLAYPVPKAHLHVLGTGVPRRIGVARSALSPKAALALGCSLTPALQISFGRVTRLPAHDVCLRPADAPLLPPSWIPNQPRCRVVSTCPRVYVRPRPTDSLRTPTAQDYEDSPGPTAAASLHDSTRRTHAYAQAHAIGHRRALGPWWQHWTHTQQWELQ